MTLSIASLTGNVELEQAEILDGYREDAGIRPAGLPDSPSLEMEMAAAFGWGVEESPEEVEAHYQEWLARQSA